MSRSNCIRSLTTVVLSALLYLFVSCVSPTNPYVPSNTQIYLSIAPTSTLKIDNAGDNIDSVGNTIKLGIMCNLSEFIDSIIIQVISPTGLIEQDTVFKGITGEKSSDTLWYNFIASSAGNETIKARAFIQQNNVYPATANIIIYSKPVINHSHPHLVISGITNISAAQTCSLSVSVNDSNTAQLHSFYVKQDTFPFTQFIPPFKWMPPVGFIGNHPVLFKVTDTDSPAYFDTQTVTITVTALIDTQSKLPHWNKDSVNLNGIEGSTISLTLSDISIGDSLSFILMPGLPAKDTIINAVYSYAFAAFDTNNYYPKIIAKDKKGNTDTMTVHLWASRTSIDSIAPIVKHLNPLTDSITVSTNSFKAAAICKDSSGIASVKCSSGSDTFATSRADSIWSATITGLVQGQYKTVTFLATDMSARANKTALNIYIKYDSTMTDTVPPLITLVSPSKDTIISSDSSLIRVKCTDASGIASVVYSIGSQKFTATRSTPTDSIFTGTVKGLAPGAYSTVTIIANDASTAHNAATATVKIKYDNDKTGPMIKRFDPAADSQSISASSYAIKVVCKDTSGVASVIFSLGTASFPATKSSDSIWSATVTNLSSGAISKITVTATDASINANTSVLALSMKYDPTMTDNVPPIIALISPSKDTTISADSCMVRVKCTDASGVASVVYALGAQIFAATRSAPTDSIFSATVKGLAAGTISTITISATDASTAHNAASATLKIKYDPTMTDLTGPVFFPKNGPANNASVVDSALNIIDSIYDPSGVDSVYWTQNGKNPKPLTLVAGSTYLYSLVDTLHRYHLDTIIIFAQDKSTNRNKSSQTIILNYNVPPVINDTAISTNRNIAKTWMLNALSVDGDPLTWTRLTSPSALSGAVTGTLPSVTFTPSTNWSGVDSFKVQVTDGHWSDTAKIKITVLNVNVAPSIVTPPSSATKNIGQSVTFSVAINADVNPAPSFVWNHNGNTITSATTSSYTIGSIALTDSGSYTVTIANSAGTITSQAVTLTVNFAPSIITQPLSQTLFLNQSVTFSVVATGKPTPTYVWKKNGVALSGKTSASLIIASSGVNDSGKYTVTVTNSLGTVISDTARFYARVKAISAGVSHSLFVKTDGTLWACGDNSFGQLGNSMIASSLSPTKIMDSVQSIAAGDYHSLILTMNGTLFACGYNINGQLGDNSLINRESPVLITTGVQSIAASGNHSLILMLNGTLLACGDNSFGQIGDNTTINRPSPVIVMTGVQIIAAGGFHSLILKNDGTLFACGNNASGQLGDSTTKSRYSPVKIMTNVKNMAAGVGHSLILTNNGTLFVYGSNGHGQLGDKSSNNDSIPEQITTGVQSIAAGEFHSLVLMANGTLFTCGYDEYGQLGNGNVIDQNSLVQVQTDLQSMAAGAYFSFFLKIDGRLFACGDNGYGQLGDGTTNIRYVPVEIKF